MKYPKIIYANRHIYNKGFLNYFKFKWIELLKLYGYLWIFQILLNPFLAILFLVLVISLKFSELTLDGQDYSRIIDFIKILITEKTNVKEIVDFNVKFLLALHLLYLFTILLEFYSIKKSFTEFLEDRFLEKNNFANNNYASIVEYKKEDVVSVEINEAKPSIFVKVSKEKKLYLEGFDNEDVLFLKEYFKDI